jgi:hypothetical protein
VTGECVQRLVDASEPGDGLCEPRWPVANLEHAHDAGGRHTAELERAGQAQHVIPRRLDLLQAEVMNAGRQETEGRIVFDGITFEYRCYRGDDDQA